MDGKAPSDTRKSESKTADRCNPDRFNAENELKNKRVLCTAHPLGRFGWRLIREDKQPDSQKPD